MPPVLNGVQSVLAQHCPATWGQWAATRHDLFPPDLCAALEHLHTQARACF